MDIPDTYAETLDKLQTINYDRPSTITAAVSARLLDQGDGEAAATIDGLVFALKRIAGFLEARGGHNDPMPDEAYRIAMHLTVTD